MINKLCYINTLLIEANISYWLDFGALLHWYRDKELDTSDIDFGIFLKDYLKLQEILEKNKERFDMIHYRDKEISLRYLGTKFDFICFDERENELWMYAYKQNPYTNNKWNWEWKAKFPKEVYFPLQTLDVEGLLLPVPNKIEEKLALQYGQDWQTPKNVACWTYDMNQAKDSTYKPIAVLMTTIARDEILFKVLPSYLQYPIKLYLLDQAEETQEKNKYYEELRQQGHFIEYSHKDIGLSGARNYLLTKIDDEEYILLTEDDIELKSNPYSLLNEFTNNNVGILGGLLIRQPNNTEQHYEYELSLQNNILEYKKSNNIDIVLNFFLAKAKVFKDIQWDEKLCLCEHSDFFYRFKQLNKWQVKYTRQLLGWHHTYLPETYLSLRKRATDIYLDMFMQKWKIKKIIKDNKIEHVYDELTVFVITHDNEPNLNSCLSALEKQSIKFKTEIIRNYHPMSIAFQEMLNICNTPYYVQLDSDMILYPNSIKMMLNAIKSSQQNECMYCFKLHDIHLNRDIDGIKIYKHDIFKHFPYNNVLGCEMEQLDRIQQANYIYKRIPTVVGDHCPIWTKESIFERYFNYIEKYKKLESSNYIQLLQKLLDIYLKNQTTINLYAFIGGLTSAIYPENLTIEKDYTQPLLSRFKYIDQAFTNYHQPTIIQAQPLSKQLVLQVSGIPCANRPYLTSKLINKYSSKYHSRHILGSQYSKLYKDIPYREFPVDLLIKKDYDEIVKLFKEASIIHIHHKMDKILLSLIPSSCKVIYTVSNINSSKLVNDTPENKALEFQIRKMSHLITVTDQPVQRNIYSYLTSRTVSLVPCLIDTLHTRTNQRPLVVFAPTNQKMDDMGSKGYLYILGLIYKLTLNGYNFNFDLIEGIPYEENIHRKQLADIIIDDVVHENFHNSSIEGAILGSVILTNYTDSKYPFLKTSTETLEKRLISLITDIPYLRQEQKKMLEWGKTIYTPEIICKEYEQLYDDVQLVDKPTPLVLDTEQSAKQILSFLQQSNIKYYLIDKSCLEIIKNKQIVSNDLYIGVETEKDKEKIENLYTSQNLHIKVETLKHLKAIKVNSAIYYVPCPVTKYLNNLFGKDWSVDNSI